METPSKAGSPTRSRAARAARVKGSAGLAGLPLDNAHTDGGGDPGVPRALGGVGGRSPQLLPLIRELYITTKERQLVRLGEVLKPDQLDFIARCQRQLDKSGQIRSVVLKARQIGISTIIEAICFVISMLYPYIKALIISHKDDSAAHILNMTRRYWDTFVFADAYQERYVSRTHLAWDNHSDIHIATAKTTDTGRSDTIQFLHASEVAFWPDATTLMDGLNNSIPSMGLTCVFLESTANGVGNYFHKEVIRAMRGDTEFEFVFYPWFHDPEYTISYLPPEMRDKYADLLDLDEEELWLRNVLHVDDDRLRWRRWHIANKCHGDVNKFHQEMPSTPHEAFIATGRNVFHWPNVLMHYRPKKGKRGKLAKINGVVRFVEDPMGWLNLFAWPSKDRDWGHYICGGDPTHAAVEGDFACIQVINRRTKEQVAVYRRKTDPITFGKDMQLIGTYFNLALLAPEKEGPGYATVGCVVADDYPNVYITQRFDKEQGKVDVPTYGWSTNGATKWKAIAHLTKAFAEPVLRIDDDEYGLIIHDEITCMEVRDYVTADDGLKFQNSDGSEYDDGVMALAIAVTVDKVEPPPPAYEEDDQPWLRTPRVRIAPVEQQDTPRTDGQEPPRDEPIDDEDFYEDEPIAPWETWEPVPREMFS